MVYIFVSSQFEKNLLNLKLKKFNDKYHDIYINDKIITIITGMGAYNVSSLISYISGIFSIKKNDTVLNFGISGSYKKNELNNIYRVNKVYDSMIKKENILDMTYNLNLSEKTLITVHRPLKNKEMKESYIYDMEGSAFYQISRKYFERQNIFIIKAISDYGFENFSKENINLDTKSIKNILEKLYNISDNQKNMYKEEKIILIKEKIYNSIFTKYQKDRLIKIVYKLILSNDFEEKILEDLLSRDFNNKKERNYYFEKFIHELT